MSKRPAENLHQPEPVGKQRKQAAGAVAAALAVGETVKRAAEVGKVSERTVYNWNRKPAFRGRVSAIREQMVGEAVGRVSRDMGSAADVLSKLLKSKSDDVRFRAAAKLIELGVKLRDHDDLARRLAELEGRVNEGADGGSAGEA